MRERYCYWSVAHGPDVDMMQGLVDSARAVGVFKDFHVWTDRLIEGAVCHAHRRRNERDPYSDYVFSNGRCIN